MSGWLPVWCLMSQTIRSGVVMTPLLDRVAVVAGWCVVAALFTATVPAGVVGGFYLAALAVGP